MEEFLPFWMACALAVCIGGRWYGCLVRLTPLGHSIFQRLILCLVPLGCIALMQVALSWGAAHEVHESSIYDLLFLAGGSAVLAVLTVGLPAFGLSGRDDAIDGGNPAAVIAVCGAWICETLCYAGGNIGEGPTIWTTFVPALGAVLALMGLWLVLEFLTKISEAISLDRDMASAIRLAAFLVAAGLVLGRAVAGNWHSWGGTLHDFIVEGWPALPLMVIAAVLQRIWRPTPQAPTHPRWMRGCVPAVGFLFIAVMVVIFLGRPEL